MCARGALDAEGRACKVLAHLVQERFCVAENVASRLSNALCERFESVQQLVLGRGCVSGRETILRKKAGGLCCACVCDVERQRG